MERMSDPIELEGGGIKKVILTEGEGTETPTPGSKVEVHYVGTLLDGTKFDSSRDRDGTFKFTIGKGEVIKGWDKGVATMKKGEKAMLTCQPEYAYGATGSPPSIPANATLQFEVELLGWTEPGRENVTDDGGVQKLTLVEGSDGGTPSYDKPDVGAVCQVNISAHIEGKDGKEARQIVNKTDEKIDLADTSLVWGVEEALLSMAKGQKCRVWVDPRYGYGSKGHKKLKVPPDSRLVYEIELLSFENPPSSWDLKTAQKIEEGQNRKLQGNTFFKAQDWARASKRYDSALDLVRYEKDLEAEQQAQVDALKVSCLGNLAQCQLKLHNFKQVVEKTTEALEVDPENEKNLFRRAKALAQVHRYEEALQDLKKIMVKSPDNQEVEKYRAAVAKRIQKEKQKERSLFKGMFNKVSLVSEKELSEAQQPEAGPADLSDGSDSDEAAVQKELQTAEPPGEVAAAEQEEQSAQTQDAAEQAAAAETPQPAKASESTEAQGTAAAEKAEAEAAEEEPAPKKSKKSSNKKKGGKKKKAGKKASK